MMDKTLTFRVGLVLGTLFSPSSVDWRDILLLVEGGYGNIFQPTPRREFGPQTSKGSPVAPSKISLASLGIAAMSLLALLYFAAFGTMFS